ncbi:MAG TPA: helix-turn-helix domain-containing protein [Actinoallomurus sp.]|jgi:transcriptional regulator of acetoin/glycerol metabolism
MESWRRSQFSGVDCDSLDPPYFGDIDIDTGSRLIQAAEPMLDQLEETLSDAAMSLLLTDAQGRVLERRVGDRSLIRYLDGILLAPGFSYAEQHVGTNGIGTALETRRLAYVCGHEHFSGRLHKMACAGAPIHDRLTGRLAGLLDVTSWHTDASPLMSALVRNAAGDIEQRMVDLGSVRERAMLTEFLAVPHRGSRAILTFSETLTMVNQQAADLLEQVDHAIIRDKVTELVRSGRGPVGQVVLSRGALAVIRCHPIATCAGTAGAVVEIDMAEDQPARRHMNRPPGLNLAGTSIAFNTVCADLEAQCRARTWALLEGEPGVGKLALAEAVHNSCTPEGTLCVIEPDDVTKDVARCLSRTASALRGSGCTVVLRHPERFAAGSLNAVVDWLDTVSGPEDRLWVVATTSAGVELPDALLNRLTVTLTVPPLRHRIHDVRELVPALLRGFNGGRSVSCGAAAMRVLLRSAWPGNVAELAQVLRHVLTRRRSGQIQPEDLPASCHTTSRRVLTAWEISERDSIVRALLETGGNKIAVAGLLGISRATVYRKINAYGIFVGPR